MNNVIYQNTIKNTVSLTGVGLHKGLESTVTFKPAPANTGLVFVRTDLPEPLKIPALASFVKETSRSTILEKSGVKVRTTEHILAALTGLQIHNAYIELDNEETPIMDGSAMPFVKVLEEAVIERQEEVLEVYKVKEEIHLKDEATESEITILPADGYQVTTLVDYDSDVLGMQYAHLKNIEDFKEEIAASRTFSFLHELKPLLEQELIKGGDLSNAIVYVDHVIDENAIAYLRKVFNKPNVKVTDKGILNNLTLHWQNEAARHKLLDVVGDLTLAGKPIQGKVIANKPGHGLNVKVAKELLKRIRAEKKGIAPIINWKSEPKMDVLQIMKMLPHRYPFLLIDKIWELTDRSVLASKCVTMNEDFFQGHFPGAPIMPGVLQIEAMAQAGGILVLSTVDDPENYLTYFMKIDKVKFKKKVSPGDVFVVDAHLITPIRRGICHMVAKGYVGDTMAVEAELMAQIVKER